MNRRRVIQFTGLPALLILSACGRREPAVAALRPGARVLALGDSLTAGNGAAPDQAWPAVLAGLTGWQIDNAGVSGDTSAGALQRLGPLLAGGRYDAVLVGIGGNDMLRRLSLQATRDNVAAILRQARSHTAHFALIATPAPEPFRAAIGSLSDADFYEDVARAEKALLIPRVYASVLSDSSLRSDQIHANARGYAAMARQLADRLGAAGWH